MTQVEIIALIATFVGVVSFAVIITMLYHSYISSSIKDVQIGKQDADLLDEVIKNGTEKRKKRKKTVAILKNVLFCVFLAFIIPVFAFAIISKANNNLMMLGGKSIMVVASGSMGERHESNTYLDEYNLNNQFQTYDIIGINKVENDSDLKKYDIVAFINDEGITVIHRIIEIDVKTNGKTYYTTRGDSNNATDTFKPTIESILGKYNGHRVPILGMFVLFFQSGSGIITAIAVIYILFMIDHLSGKLAKACEERVVLITNIFDISNMSTEDIEIMKVGHVEYISYKGHMYRIGENGLIDKQEITDQYHDQSIVDLLEELTIGTDDDSNSSEN